MANSQHLTVHVYQGVVLVQITMQRLLDPLVINAIHADLIALTDRHPRISLIIDLSEVRYLASAAVGKLIATHKRVASLKGRMAVAGIRPEVKPILSAIQFEKVVHTAPDAESVILLYRRTPLSA